MYKIRSGRLRHIVSIYTPGSGTNEYGEPVGDVLLFEARAEVQIKTGGQLTNYGTVLTSEIVTALMYYDERANNNQVMVWNEKRYEIKHISRDTTNHSMIITAEIIDK